MKSDPLYKRFTWLESQMSLFD